MSTSDERAEQAAATQPVDEIRPDEPVHHGDDTSVAFAGARPEPAARALDDPDDLDDLDDLDDDVDEPDPLPISSRRRRLSVATAVLALAAVAAAGFYAGVLVQKHQKSSSSSAASTLQALASRFGRGTGGNGAAAAGGAGGGTGGFGGVRGTVKLVDGANIYVTDAQGNTVKVATNAGSHVTKTVTGTAGDVRIGDTVVVQGPQGSDGTYQAQRVTIGGAGGGFGGFGGGGGLGGGGAGAAAGGGAGG